MQMSLVCVMMNTSHIKALSNKERSRHHERKKRRDSKGRILHTGESQRTDGKYLYKYVDAFGNTKYVYAWRLTPTDPTPKGKREKPSLRELEQQIRRDIEDGIDSTGKKNDALPTLRQTERTEGKREEKHTETTGTTHAVIERGQVRC